MTVDISRMKLLLSYFYGKNENSNNQSILRIFKTEMDEISLVMQDVINNYDIDQAHDYGLDVLGANVNLPRLGRSDDEYRTAIKIEDIKNVSTGTIPDIREILQLTFDTDEIGINENDIANIEIQVPVDGPITDFDDLEELADNVAAAGVGVDVFLLGSFILGGVDGETSETEGLSNAAETIGGQLGGAI